MTFANNKTADDKKLMNVCTLTLSEMVDLDNCSPLIGRHFILVNTGGIFTQIIYT